MGVVLDESGPDGPELYVDADRNRRIEPEDRRPGAGPSWRVPLDVLLNEGGETPRRAPRVVVFRRGATGLTLAFGTAGYLAGTLDLGDGPRPARRQDGDGNGLLADPRDRLWIDADGDGRWDPATEQLPFAGTLTLGPRRFAARSDALGGRLAIRPLEGAGTIRLALDGVNPGGARVLALESMLAGRDGAVLGLSDPGGVADVPVGEYRLTGLSLTLADPGGGEPWSYVFAEPALSPPPPDWKAVAHDSETTLAPLSGLVFEVEHLGPQAGIDGPGDARVRPRLRTAGGLALVTCFRGNRALPGSEDGPGAMVRLVGPGGRVADEARSGFA